MFEQIVVPLDGSALAEQALPVAARLARAGAGEVVLAHVVFTPRAYQYYDVTEAEVKEARGYLEALSSSEELAGDGTRVAVTVSIAHPASGLLSLIESQQIDLVVMSSHGYTGFKRWALGGVAHHIIHHSPAPVLLLQESQEEALVPEPARPLCALVALDGSPFAEAALLPAAHLVAALAGPAGGALHLTQVVQLPVDAQREEILHQLGPQGLTPIQQYLVTTGKRVQDAAKDLKLLLHWSITLDTDIADALLRTAEGGGGDGTAETSVGYDLIALSTHGRGGIERWVMGSVTERVLNATRLPLLIVRPMSR